MSLICLNNHVKYAQAKCIAVNPRRPELIAIGSNDCYARVYDRRMMILDSVIERVLFAPTDDDSPRPVCLPSSISALEPRE